MFILRGLAVQFRAEYSLLEDVIKGKFLLTQMRKLMPYANLYHNKKDMVIQVVDVSLFDKKTIGELGYSHIENYLQIFSFNVHKSYRRKGYGTRLINKLKKIARKKEVEWIQVFPNSRDDLSDEPISIDVLNKIYEKYGFTEKEEGFDYSKPNQLMKMHIVS